MLFYSVICYANDAGDPAQDLNRQGLRALREGKARNSIEYFCRAIEKDPRIAKIHWNLACAIGLSLDTFPQEERSSLEAQCFSAIRTAVAIEPNLKKKLATEPELKRFSVKKEYWIAAGYQEDIAQYLVLINNPEETDNTRRMGVRELCNRGSEVTTEMIPIAFLVDALTDGDDGGPWREKSVMASLQDRIEEALPAIRTALRAGDCLNGAVGVQALGLQGGPLVPDLIPCLSNDYNFVSKWVAPAFLTLGKTTLPSLVKALNHSDPRLAGHSAEIIGLLKGNEHVADLTTAGHRASPYLLGRVRLSLERLDTFAGREALKSVPKHPSGRENSSPMTSLSFSPARDKLLDQEGRVVFSSSFTLDGFPISKSVMGEKEEEIPTPFLTQAILSNSGRYVAIVFGASYYCAIVDMKTGRIFVLKSSDNKNFLGGITLYPGCWSPDDYFLHVFVTRVEGEDQDLVYDVESNELVLVIDNNQGDKHFLGWSSWNTIEMYQEDLNPHKEIREPIVGMSINIFSPTPQTFLPTEHLIPDQPRIIRSTFSNHTIPPGIILELLGGPMRRLSWSPSQEGPWTDIVIDQIDGGERLIFFSPPETSATEIHFRFSVWDGVDPTSESKPSHSLIGKPQCCWDHLAIPFPKAKDARGT